MVRRADADPGLPIKFGPCSNGEFDPRPLTPVVAEAVRRAREECDANARKLGMSRRSFLLSLCGAATTLLALQRVLRRVDARGQAPQAGRSLRHPDDRDH